MNAEGERDTRRRPWRVIVAVLAIASAAANFAGLSLAVMQSGMPPRGLQGMLGWASGLVGHSEWVLAAGPGIFVFLMIAWLVQATGGIMLLCRDDGARLILMASSWAEVVAAALYVVTCVLFVRQPPPQEQLTEMAFGLIWPVALLVWFYRPNIRTEMAAWAVPRERNEPGAS